MYLCWHVASYGVNDTQLEQNVNYMRNRKCLPLVIGHHSNTNTPIIMFEATVWGTSDKIRHFRKYFRDICAGFD